MQPYLKTYKRLETLGWVRPSDHQGEHDSHCQAWLLSAHTKTPAPLAFALAKKVKGAAPFSKGKRQQRVFDKRLLHHLQQSQSGVIGTHVRVCGPVHLDAVKGANASLCLHVARLFGPASHHWLGCVFVKRGCSPVFVRWQELHQASQAPRAYPSLLRVLKSGCRSIGMPKKPLVKAMRLNNATLPLQKGVDLPLLLGQTGV